MLLTVLVGGTFQLLDKEMSHIGGRRKSAAARDFDEFQIGVRQPFTGASEPILFEKFARIKARQEAEKSI